MKRKIIWSFALLACLCCLPSAKTKAQTKNAAIIPGEVWKDTDGNPINAHGGGLLYHEGTYYWYGEYKKGETILPEWATWECYRTDVTGVSCYSSKDLLNWKFEGIVLPAVKDDEKHDLHPSKVLERPKVIYNEKTKKFVMWAHVESADYSKACAGVAVSDSPTGPYCFVSSSRVCPGIFPLNMTEEERDMQWNMEQFEEWWTPEWREAVNKGLFVKRDLEGGQMSRDMTLYVDDDGIAYHIYSSEENLTLQIAELTDDYQGHSGKYVRLFPGGHNEAPAIFKKDGTYWMITSGCTGWAPNAARLFSAPSIWGPWTQHPNPCRGEGSDKTFGGQSTYVLQLPGNRYLFMADIWRPKSLMYSEYLWIPVRFDEEGMPYLTLSGKCNPSDGR